MKADPGLPRFHPDSASLIKKHLSRDRFASLANVRTGSGFTLDKAIQSGIQNPDSSIGIYAGDEESYQSFARIFLPIIMEYHNLDSGQSHDPLPMSPVSRPHLDPGGSYIKSTRIRVARNLSPFPFSCHMEAEHREMVETATIKALKKLPQRLAGRYFSFSHMDKEEYQDLIRQKLAFPEGDRFMDAAGMNRDFPLARGVFLSQDKNFRVWVNEEDHLRVMALSRDSDIAKVFNSLAQGLEVLSRDLVFSYDDHLGFLSSCPTNLGTAMRAGVHICLKKLEQRPSLLNRLAADHHLQIRGTSGEKTAVDKSVFDISNARRLGISANQIVSDLYAGLEAIILTEKNL